LRSGELALDLVDELFVEVEQLAKEVDDEQQNEGPEASLGFWEHPRLEVVSWRSGCC
jgi:hypothetical protein